MHNFFDTAIGKTTRTLLWTVGSYAVALGLADLSKVHWSDKAVALGVPGLINVIAYGISVVLDKEIPNTPSSPKMQLVQVDPPAAEVVTPEEPVAPTPPEPSVVAPHLQ